MKSLLLLVGSAIIIGCGSSTARLEDGGMPIPDGGPSMGEEGGFCYPNGTCNSNLICRGGICAHSNTNTDGGAIPDGGSLGDGGIPSDGGSIGDGGVNTDGGPIEDGGLIKDGGLITDGGIIEDGGLIDDGGTIKDGGQIEDGGNQEDGGLSEDGGEYNDGGLEGDGGMIGDGGFDIDGGHDGGITEITVTRLTYNAQTSISPSMVWGSNEFGLAWIDFRDGNAGELYFMRINPNSPYRIGNERRITWHPGHHAYFPSITWSGSEYGLAWSDNCSGWAEIYFIRLNSDNGQVIDDEKRITWDENGTTNNPSLAWSGSEYGVAWNEQVQDNWEIFFTHFSSTGHRIGDTRRITWFEKNSTHPSLVWSGNEFSVAWMDQRSNYLSQLYFARIDPGTGQRISEEIRLTHHDKSTSVPSLAWSGSEIGLAWCDNRNGADLYFVRIDPLTGNKIDVDQRITWNSSPGGLPSLVWNGCEFGLAWCDNRNGNTEIYFTRIDPSTGYKIGYDLRISHNDRYDGPPSLAWTGSQYGIAWHQPHDTGADLHFALISNITKCP